MIRRFHEISLRLAQRALQEQPTPRRDFTSLTFAGNERQLEDLRQEIRKVYDKASALASSSEQDPDTVFVFPSNYSLWSLKVKLIPKIFFLLLLSLSAFAKNGFVGNPAHAVILPSGKTYLTDLYVAGIHQDAYVGEVQDAKFKNLDLGIEYPDEMLAQKLTDLENVAPGLGIFTHLALKAHSWSFVEGPLTPIELGNGPVELPAGTQTVLAANRLKGWVRIQRRVWNNLDDVHKTALLLHEALYSLVIPKWKGGHFTQLPHEVMALTARAFLSPTLQKAYFVEFMRDPRIRGFNLPSTADLDKGGARTAVASYGYDLEKMNQQIAYTQKGSQPLALEAYIKDICEAGWHLSLGGKLPYYIRFEVSRYSLRLREYSYQAGDGVLQTGLKLAMEEEYLSLEQDTGGPFRTLAPCRHFSSSVLKAAGF